MAAVDTASQVLTRDWQQNRGKRGPKWTADGQAAETVLLRKWRNAVSEVRDQNRLESHGSNRIPAAGAKATVGRNRGCSERGEECRTTGLLAISFHGCKTACCESDRSNRRSPKGVTDSSDIVKVQVLRHLSAQGCEVL